MAFQPLDHEEQYYRQKIGQSTTVAIGVASARSSQLQPGRYVLVASIACYLRQGDSTVAATSSDMPLLRDTPFYITVDSQRHSNGTDVWNDANDGSDGYVAVIRQASNGTLFITKVSDLRAVT